MTVGEHVEGEVTWGHVTGGDDGGEAVDAVVQDIAHVHPLVVLAVHATLGDEVLDQF